jgi:hypothetical protein
MINYCKRGLLDRERCRRPGKLLPEFSERSYCRRVEWYSVPKLAGSQPVSTRIPGLA